MNAKALVCGLACFAAAGMVSAATYTKKEFICPLDGSVFEATMAVSGTSFEQQLDLKPFGPMPAPWPLARCPSNGFVIYKEEFSADEIDRLKRYVLSPAYQALREDNSDYYLAAQLLQFMDADADEVAWSLLQATWEVEADATRYRRYAQEALAKFSELLTKPRADRQEWVTRCSWSPVSSSVA